MNRQTKLTVCFLGAAWLQIVLAPSLKLGIAIPDFLFLVIAFFTFVLSSQHAYEYAFIIGLIKDVLSRSTFGMETASLIIGTAVLHILLVTRFDQNDVFMQIIAAFVLSFISMLAFLLFGVWIDKSMLSFSFGLQMIFWTSFYTSLFAPLFFKLLSHFLKLRTNEQQYELF